MIPRLSKTCLIQEDMHLSHRNQLILQLMKAFKFLRLIIKKDLLYRQSRKGKLAIMLELQYLLIQNLIKKSKIWRSFVCPMTKFQKIKHICGHVEEILMVNLRLVQTLQRKEKLMFQKISNSYEIFQLNKLQHLIIML